MEKLREHYFLRYETMGLFPAKHLEFQTLVRETERSFYVKESPLEIIKNTLIHNYSSYESRRKTVMLHNGYRRKVPIPIHLDSHYMFPTHAIEDINCSWITLHHIDQIRVGTNEHNAHILFQNGQEILLPITAGSLREQRKRTKIVKKTATKVSELIMLRSS